MKRVLPVAALSLLVGNSALAHRLDEYLQGTILSVEKGRVNAQITLTPGVSVFPILLTEIDNNRDGAISAVEQHAYAERVLRDVSLRIDGHPLQPHLLSTQFPTLEEMKNGRGEIRIEFDADLPAGGLHRKLTFENHHLSQMAAYQVNCLVPRDRDIRIVGQNRNYSQTFYELSFEQAGVGLDASSFAWLREFQKPLGMIALLLSTWLAVLWWQRV